MGPYCNYCSQRCFVPFPDGTPQEIMDKYRPGVTIIATCTEGQIFERQQTGYCYTDIDRSLKTEQEATV